MVFSFKSLRKDNRKIDLSPVYKEKYSEKSFPPEIQPITSVPLSQPEALPSVPEPSARSAQSHNRVPAHHRPTELSDGSCYPVPIPVADGPEAILQKNGTSQSVRTGRPMSYLYGYAVARKR